MNARAIIPLVAGLGIGGLALKLGINVLQNAKGGQNSERVQVWSARTEIPRGTAVAAEMLQAVTFPQDLLPPGTFKDKDKLVGRVARLVIPASLPVLENMLAPPGALGGVFPKPGYRAVAVKIDESSGVDYHLEPGCFVDVLGSTKDRKGNSATARLVVENVEIAAVGDKISPAEKPAEGGGKSKEKPRPVRAVTLYVKPDQAKKLLMAEQEGPIKLALRGSAPAGEPVEEELDGPDQLEQLADANAENQSAALEWLRNVFAPPAPPVAEAAPPPPEPLPEPWVVTIYRGLEQQTVQFKSRDSRERVSESSSAGAGKNLFENVPRKGRPPAEPAEPSDSKS